MKYSVESVNGNQFLQREHADGQVETIARIGSAQDAERIARMLNAGEAAMAMLIEIEWGDTGDTFDCCPSCGNHDGINHIGNEAYRGHRPDCPLAATLAAWEEAGQ